MSLNHEPCPPNLDDEAREIWQQCREIIEGRSHAPELSLQALWICRELRQESKANAALEAGKQLAEACRLLVHSRDAGIYPLSMANRITEIGVALAVWDATEGR